MVGTQTSAVPAVIYPAGPPVDPAAFAAITDLMRHRPASHDPVSARARWLFELAAAFDAAGLPGEAAPVREAGLALVRDMAAFVAGGAL
ncbi:hypothetical protein [Amycolatopsis sp. NPDC059021]|uniref:hypothetical protein n=1 Tax=Amycolatopsis sp. NPDC059021 TaxID=3346704 RepID=UPI00367278A7